MAILGGWRLTRMGVFFAIGIVVLAGLVTGGIFLVRNHGEQVRRDEAVKIAEQNLKDQSDTSTKPVAVTDDSNKAANSGANTAADPSTNAATTSPDSSAAPAALPQTGIDGGRVLIVSILALSVAFYVASRHAKSQA